MPRSELEIKGLSWLNGTEESFVGTSTSTVVPWEAAALLDTDRFERDIRLLGLPGEDVQAAVDAHKSAVEEGFQTALLSSKEIRDPSAAGLAVLLDRPGDETRMLLEIYNSVHRSVLRRLASWGKSLSIRIDYRKQLRVPIPLFLISAANVSGCTASFTMHAARAQDLGWVISILGAGLGRDRWVRASASATFRTAAGETKAIILPVMVAIEKVTVLRRGTPVSQGYRIDVGGVAKQRQDLSCRLLAPGAKPPIGELEHNYQLSGDTTGAIASYEYIYEQAKACNLQVGIKAYGADLHLDVKSEMVKSVKLAYDLRGGYDYDLHRVRETDGVIWAAPSTSLEKQGEILDN